MLGHYTSPVMRTQYDHLVLAGRRRAFEVSEHSPRVSVHRFVELVGSMCSARPPPPSTPVELLGPSVFPCYTHCSLDLAYGACHFLRIHVPIYYCPQRSNCESDRSVHGRPPKPKPNPSPRTTHYPYPLPPPPHYPPPTTPRSPRACSTLQPVVGGGAGWTGGLARPVTALH